MFRPHADPGPMLIPIVSGIAFDPREVEETFVRASGPGGQNVNKVSSAVQLKLDLRRPGSLPEALRARVERLGGHRVSGDGVLVIQAQRHRSQDRNRQDALDRRRRGVGEQLEQGLDHERAHLLERLTHRGQRRRRRRREDRVVVADDRQVRRDAPRRVPGGD